VLVLFSLSLQLTWKKHDPRIGTSKGAASSVTRNAEENQVLEVPPLQQVALNLESNLRGDEGGHPLDLDLPRGRLQLTLQLPSGARPGKYLVRLAQQPGKLLLETEGVASTNERKVSILRIDEIDTSKIIPGRYQLSLRRGTLGWTDFDVQVK
jgi:hypothetical protein